MKKKIRRGFADIVIAVVQIVTYFIFAPITRLFFWCDTRLSETISNLSRGSLIVSNHESILDPFLIGFHLPVRTFLASVPMRFPMTPKIFRKLPFLALYGAYNIGKTKRERMIGLLRTRQYLIDGETVMIFPEGKVRVATAGMQEFQKGILFFADVAEKVVFVRMDGFHRSEWMNIFKQRSMAFSDVHNFQGQNINLATLESCVKTLSD